MLQKGDIDERKYNIMVYNIYLCDTRSSINMIRQTLRRMAFWCEGLTDHLSSKFDPSFQRLHDTTDQSFQRLHDTIDQSFQRLHDTIDRRFNKTDRKIDTFIFVVIAGLLFQCALDTYLRRHRAGGNRSPQKKTQSEEVATTMEEFA